MQNYSRQKPAAAPSARGSMQPEVADLQMGAPIFLKVPFLPQPSLKQEGTLQLSFEHPF